MRGLKSKGCLGPNIYPEVPDGGWGWAVAVAFFVVEVCTYGTLKSLGVFLQDLMEEFGESNSRVSWVISICVFIFTFTGQTAFRISLYQMMRVLSAQVLTSVSEGKKQPKPKFRGRAQFVEKVLFGLDVCSPDPVDIDQFSPINEKQFAETTHKLSPSSVQPGLGLPSQADLRESGPSLTSG